jgi:hypothetical protein
MDDKVYVEGLYNYDRLKDDESRSIVSKSNMKEVARKLPITPKYVFIQETANLDENVISELGFPKDIYRTIRNVNKRTNMGSLRDNNDISEEFKYTISDNLFLQYDSSITVRNKMIILFTSEYLSLIRTSEIWLCNKTFKSSPSDFMQVFIIYSRSMINNYQLYMFYFLERV